MKVSKNFTVAEYVNPDILAVLGETRAANIINPYLIKTVEKLRSIFGPIIINGNYGGQKFINSGVRTAEFYTEEKKCGIFGEKVNIYKPSYSTHLFCNTGDLKFTDSTPIEVYNYIIRNQSEFLSIVRMENAEETITWLHIECGKYRNGAIQVFNP